MNEYINYDVLAQNTKVQDMTSCKHNQEILRKLKKNDPDFNEMLICYGFGLSVENKYWYYIVDGDDLGWLGYFLGRNTSVKILNLYLHTSVNVESFHTGLSRNKSIRKIHIHGIIRNGIHRANEKFFDMMFPFFKCNHNLTDIAVEDCMLGNDGTRLLSLAVAGCKSLKCVRLERNQIGGPFASIVVALSMHPNLQKLHLVCMNIGSDECTSLASLLRTTKQLQTLNLSENNIDDDGVEMLVHAISGSMLQKLNLSRNRSITARGWKKVSTLLEMPDSNLKKLHLLHNTCQNAALLEMPHCYLKELNLCYNNLGDEGALIFANALRGNNTLETLGLYGNDITAEGWTHFSKLLCDTSSVNNTYLSNHTLATCLTFFVSKEVMGFLDLNRSSHDKRQIAMTKILQCHSHFDMQPFSNWELKILSLVIDWYEKADARTTGFEEKIKKMKLACVYEFIREFPMLYIDKASRAMEMQVNRQMSRHAKRKVMETEYTKSSCCVIL